MVHGLDLHEMVDACMIRVSPSLSACMHICACVCVMPGCIQQLACVMLGCMVLKAAVVSWACLQLCAFVT